MAFVAAPEPVPATSLPDLDLTIAALHAKKDAWKDVSLADRAALLDRCITSMVAVSERWAAAGARIKGLAPDHAGEEWVSGPMPSIRNARLLANALRQGGAPKPASVSEHGGRTVARVFPSTTMEKLMFAGVRADVWIKRGKPASQGAVYRDTPEKGRVALVLGGGNVSSIPPMDALYKLFVEGELVLLKMNPVNESIGPILAEGLAPLVDGGWLAIVYGGADVGAHAAAHAKIDSLHVTGSDRTYDAIVWGKNDKTAGVRANDKPFTAELGCVTPVIVVPGPWSESDLRFQARHVASMVTHNASFNCNAAKVVVVAKEWLQREAFVRMIDEELARTPARKAYYPGAKERYRAFIDHYPKARVVGETGDEVVPWTVLAIEGSTYALENEAFCGVVAIVALEAPDHGNASPTDFLEKAVTFANDRCWGTLSCCVLVHPATEKTHPAAVTKAIDELRYGGIGINVWPGLIYGLVSPSWGAFPGHSPDDIRSGVGVVHNAWLFDHPEKSVVRGPFRIRPTPAWFSDHKNLDGLGRALVAFEAAPTWKGFAKVVLAGLKG